MLESDVIRILNRHCTEQKMKFFAHVYRGTKGYILDGFALSRAYSRMKTVGYEIKVSRSDFLQDKKWQNYLPVCNTFYFVSPPDIIYKDDLPEGIGLYHCTEKGLSIIKKAKRNEYDKDALFEVLQYISLHRGFSEREKIKSAIARMNYANRELQRIQRDKRQADEYNNELSHELFMLKHGGLRNAK